MTLALEIAPPSPLTRPILVLDVLSAECCASCVAGAESRPWRPSAVAEDGTRSRSVTNGDLDIDASVLFDAIRSRLPAAIHGWKLKSISVERCVFLRYAPGDFFDVHTDGVYKPSARERSMFAIVFYLNDAYVGGYTRFPDIGLDVEPRTGAALLVPHGLRHQGLPVKSGVKYGLHTYALYAAPQRQRTRAPEQNGC